LPKIKLVDSTPLIGIPPGATVIGYGAQHEVADVVEDWSSADLGSQRFTVMKKAGKKVEGARKQVESAAVTRSPKPPNCQEKRTTPSSNETVELAINWAWNRSIPTRSFAARCVPHG